MSQINDKFLKPYDSNATEDAIYQKWLDSGYFNPDKMIADGLTEKDAEKFSIVLPPPNVTGILHLGHASMLAIEDIMIRYNRMLGKKTLWVPGTDHAAIATQSKVEKILSKDGIRKNDLGREKFLEKVNAFATESHDTIVSQLKKMGASLDWSREAFTLDKKRELAVRTAFKKMYEDGLIYRDFKIVNWDPKGQTTISDDEVIHEKQKGKLYYFKYSKDFPISIATTRPETKIGDTGVAVHPEDARYKDFIGQEFEFEFVDVKVKVKVFGDPNIDPEFGTGAVGVTPAHSFTDYDMALKNNLEIKPVINEYAKISAESEILKDKKTIEAREIILDWLRENSLLEKEEEIEQNISKAERTNAVIEPLPKLQWFINVNKEFEIQNSNISGIENGQKTTLKKLMLASVKNGQINILPERFEKTYFHWIENLRDWCISRQIWYGHQIPVWYKKEDNKSDEIFVGLEKPDGENWIQDEDTLDTWFSSGLWTFSTLGWPEETEDFKTYHPTDVLETGYDIIFFWVARMILMSSYLLGDIPFKTVYLHGMVRDPKGKKMSKSLGNIIDPNEMIEKYGTDALRMSLIVGIGPGNDMNASEEKIKAYKKFANKIWNATRFVLENIQSENLNNQDALLPEDQEKIKEFDEILKDINSDIQNFRYYLASEKIYHYFWHNFADIIIEENKENLKSENLSKKISSQKMIYELLIKQLKVLHPFMPFITEEIWSHLPKKDSELLLTAKWPNQNE